MLGAQVAGAHPGVQERARTNATSVERLSELPVAEAAKLVRHLDPGQLRTALRRERDGKGRKTLIQRLEAELGKR
ncbi:hypothetical protein OG792_12030 [Micromonospora sp. NBC_01699]|uniref:hypothetical protein n=1 Tax=Micromonospora sp. NBC_01699 TaxID=2975984 RepID=UPI002E323BEB|nr:hypothetical protein [Micromonospora sp. NBC_01699]